MTGVDTPRQPRTSVARRVTGAILALAGLASFLLALAAVWNPWRLVRLFALAEPGPGIVLMLAGGGLVIVGAFVALPGRGWKIVAGAVAPLTVAAAVSPGLPGWWADEAYGPGLGHLVGVVAASPDDRFEVAAFRDASTTRLVLRTRDGLLSRQAETPVAACESFSDVVEPGQVRFIDSTTVGITTGDEPTILVAFDPGTLAATGAAANC